MKVKVTAIVHGKEIELGVFNQGVVFDFDKDYSLDAPVTLRDVATGKAIVKSGAYGGTWRIEWTEEEGSRFDTRTDLTHVSMNQLFIQAA